MAAEIDKAGANRVSQANGALMRCSPIGIWARDRGEAALVAREDAALTHPSPVCRAASAAFAAAIAAGIGGADKEGMIEAANVAVPEPEDAPVRGGIRLAQLGVPPDDFMRNQGWVLIAFQNAFCHFAVGTPLELALVETVGAGGDTDTNAAICGALLGAAQGRAAVPPQWTMAILSCRPHAELGARRPRPTRYWPDDVPAVAEALLARRLRAASWRA